MLFLLRGHVRNVSCNFRNTVNKVKLLEFCLPLLFNLNTEDSSNCKNLFSTKTSLPVTDGNVKRYMNYLIYAYQNNKARSQSIGEILKIKRMSYLLDEKLHILENMNSLKDLVSCSKKLIKVIFTYVAYLLVDGDYKIDGRIEPFGDRLRTVYAPIDFWSINAVQEFLDSLSNTIHIEHHVDNNKDMESLAKEEEAMYVQQIQDIDEQTLDVILQHLDEENHNNVIIEIIPGVGGQEAMLFTHDLLNMYIGYLEYLQLDYEVIEMDKSEMGGIKRVVIAVTSPQGYTKFKYEGGVHRVQRIPATERSGRLHTSTATVIVLPEPSEVEVELDKKDLKIEAKKSSGAGGQHVNTTDSAIRITHLPTGIVVNCQINKSQIQNRKWALMKLRSLLYEQQYEKQASYIGELRKKQIGKRTRNEKIRTYNYNQDRVTDHRLSNSTVHSLRTFMKGGQELEELEKKLHRSMRWKMLLELIEKADSELKHTTGVRSNVC